MSVQLAVVVPVFNEAENIPLLVQCLDRVLKDIDWEVIFVDDDSPDGTAEIVRQLGESDPRVRCIQRIERRGLSSAVLEGMLSSSAPYIAVMDADLQHDENILPLFLESLRQGDTDVVIGTRYGDGGSTGTLASRRVKISKLATYLGSLVIKAKVSDPMSGYFMLTRSFFEQVKYKVSGTGYKILLDLLASSSSAPRVKEIPYHMRKRLKGESKLDTMAVWEYLLLLMDKSFGKYVPVRFLMFATVGLSGVAIHLLFLGALFYAGTEFYLAQIAATIIAMSSNFLLNNIFTYRDKRLHGAELIRGLFSFYLACSIGAVINVQIADLLFSLDVVWWVAGTLGAVIGSVWNFAITSTFTWSKKKDPVKTTQKN
jgi:dolichol-phosphate mannosyltransferase